MTTRLRVLSLALSVALTHPAQGQTGTVNAHFTADDALREHPVMISAIQGGQVVEQQETKLPHADKRLNPLQPGVYAVRVEGDGAVTEVKRGVHVFAGREVDLQFVLHAGKGAHVVEYATGGLSREEVAARLANLEGAVKQIQQAERAKAGAH